MSVFIIFRGASHATDLSSSSFGHLHNNNNNNHSILGESGKSMVLKLSSSYTESAAVLNLSKCSTLNGSGEDYYSDYYVKPELDLSAGALAGSSSSGSSIGCGNGAPSNNPVPAHQHQANNDSRVSSAQWAPPFTTKLWWFWRKFSKKRWWRPQRIGWGRRIGSHRCWLPLSAYSWL